MTKPEKKIKNGFTGAGLTEDEQSIGRARYADYLKNYPQLNKLSNLQLLEELVWLECLQERFKKQVGIVSEPTQGPDGKIKVEAIPKHLSEAVANGLTQIMELKSKLGLFEDQKTLDAFKDFEDLKKKAAEFRKTHPLSFKCTCPFCSRIFFLKRRTDKFEEFKSPFFADDKVLKNTPLHRLYKQGKITREEFAEVLGVSPDYADWLDEHIYKTAKPKE
jgi:hypothetical protein